jgi:hypothetical protein
MRVSTGHVFILEACKLKQLLFILFATVNLQFQIDDYPGSHTADYNQVVHFNFHSIPTKA